TRDCSRQSDRTQLGAPHAHPHPAGSGKFLSRHNTRSRLSGVDQVRLIRLLIDEIQDDDARTPDAPARLASLSRLANAEQNDARRTWARKRRAASRLSGPALREAESSACSAEHFRSTGETGRSA